MLKSQQSRVWKRGEDESDRRLEWVEKEDSSENESRGVVKKTVVRAAMSSALETLRERQEAAMEAAEIKTLSSSLGVTWMDKIRDENIRGTANIRCFWR